ncbi:hypothetical protein EDD86DRAFT_208615 [Gorgonomyces haynaldii]|nr:hypothetical protein EDD86DRAFT_208615 [Gorgonomyces haynaldii]
MAPLISFVLHGIIAGVYFTHAKVDSLYWSYISVPVEQLKSRVPLSQRQEGINYYKIEGNPSLEYVLLVMTVLVILSQVGGFVRSTRSKLTYLVALVLFAGAVGVEFVYTRPLIAQIQKGPSRVSNTTTERLSQIAFYHLITFGLVLFSGSMSIQGAEQDEIEDEKEKQE